MAINQETKQIHHQEHLTTLFQVHLEQNLIYVFIMKLSKFTIFFTMFIGQTAAMFVECRIPRKDKKTWLPYLMVRIETSYERNQVDWDPFSRILYWIFPTSYSRISIGTNFFIIWFKHINIKINSALKCINTIQNQNIYYYCKTFKTCMHNNWLLLDGTWKFVLLELELEGWV